MNYKSDLVNDILSFWLDAKEMWKKAHEMLRKNELYFVDIVDGAH